MTNIYLNDLLKLSNRELENVKVKFNQWNGEVNPLDEYLINPSNVNDGWLFWRTKVKNYSVGQIAVCLVKVSEDVWLLTSVRKVIKELGIENGINYKGEDIPEYKQYFGRVIIKYHKHIQPQCLYMNNISNDLIVTEILPIQYAGLDFPGYDKVVLTYKELETIIKRNKSDWVNALNNQKAVYILTDLKTGLLYVGSATGERGMLLSRWKDYISNGHGGNAGLKALVENKGFDYIKQNFQFSILENYNARVDNHIILQREKWWKNVLQSKDAGYNLN